MVINSFFPVLCSILFCTLLLASNAVQTRDITTVQCPYQCTLCQWYFGEKSQLKATFLYHFGFQWGGGQRGGRTVGEIVKEEKKVPNPGPTSMVVSWVGRCKARANLNHTFVGKVQRGNHPQIWARGPW